MTTPFVRNTIDGIVVGLLYIVEGGSMGNEHSVLQHVYVANSRTEVERMICEDYSIANGNVNEWLSRVWGSLVYDDAETRTEAAIPENQPTAVMLLKDVEASLDPAFNNHPQMKVDNHTIYYGDSIVIDGDLNKGVLIPSGTVLTLPYKAAQWLLTCAEDVFVIVKGK